MTTSQPYEIIGKDGKKHTIWAFSPADAYKQAAKWGYRHGGFDSVCLLRLNDELEGCWDRATRIDIGRQASGDYALSRLATFQQ